MGTKSYSYPVSWRITEILGIVAFFGLLFVTGFQAWTALTGPFQGMLWVIAPCSVFLAMLGADFTSGLFHFLADNFGREDMPFLGPNIIRTFREHHNDPKEMVLHDWIESNGSNCLICIPMMLLFLALIPTQQHLVAACFMSFWTFFLVGIVLTCQCHKWSHQDDRPGWVRFLQRCWLVLPEDHHSVHHTAPYDRYYCITLGWLNPVLDWIGFWPRLFVILAPFLPRSERDAANTRAANWTAS